MAHTTISRNWLAKMTLFIAAFIGLGIWGFVDATIVYPNRGERYAEFMEYKYLQALNESGEVLRASVDDPAETLETLGARERDIVTELATLSVENVARRRYLQELARLEWLRSLAIVGQARPERTAFGDPQARLVELEAKWSTQEQPKGLSALDIPSQWLFVAIGVVGAVWLGLTVMRVTRTVFRYDEATRTLTLPSGTAFTPAEIVEIDKRKWDKFFVTVKLADNSSHKLDLLRYQPLEAWVLEMEKHSPNYEPPDEPAEGDSPGSTDPAGDETPRESGTA